MFSYNENGNITYNGEAYPFSTHGASNEGQRRAGQFAEWLNDRTQQAAEQITLREVERLRAVVGYLSDNAEKALSVLWTDNDSRGYGTDEEGQAAMELQSAICAARAALAEK